MNIDKGYILSLLEPGVSYTVDTLLKFDKNLKAAGATKVTELMRQLMRDGILKREVIRRVAFFSLVNHDHDNYDDEEEYNYFDNSSSFEIPLDFHVTINGKEYRF